MYSVFVAIEDSLNEKSCYRKIQTVNLFINQSIDPNSFDDKGLAFGFTCIFSDILHIFVIVKCSVKLAHGPEIITVAI